jgi:DNA excision repair protein ERCC-4
MFTGGEEQLVGHVPFKIIKNDTLAKNRLETYLHGGVISITSRIMLIDLLKNRIPIHMVTGIMLLDAHRVTEYSLEAFILELFRTSNTVGFIKAFSGRAEALTGGFAKVEKMCKFLKTPKLLLYPRFHATVKGDLDDVKLNVEELHVSMTGRMKVIQLGLLELMELCLNEVVRANPALDVKEFNMETAITLAFDQQIRRQLDPIWHRVTLKSKSLIEELRVLRVLLLYLVEYDPISYCKFLETLVMADASSSGTGEFRSYWLMMETAQTVIQTAKDRVFSLSPSGVLTPTIEEIRKWTALNDLLKASSGQRLLIMTDEEHTKRRLTKIITGGYKEWQEGKYREYLDWKKKARKQGGFITGVAAPSQSSTSTFRRKSRPTRPQPVEVDDGQFDELESKANDLETGILPENLGISCYDSDTVDDYVEMLIRHRPQIVIMYESDLAFIRALELYSYRRGPEEEPLAINVLVYQDSVEEQLQLLGIRQEKEAFENLIRIKSTMAPLIGSDTGSLNKIDEMESARVFSGLTEEIVRTTIIVDIRELRSSLPFVLYKQGFILEPLTIEVGDYILSPDLCVERKSTSDLISSLNNGRLYLQAEQLTRHYANPILLIEFDENRPFSLLPSGDVRAEISISDIASKLCLLLLHFPRLKLIWSPSLAATAETFRDLKRDQPEPILPSERSRGEGADPTARDMLLALPGVNGQNYFSIMRHVRNMRELCQCSRIDLEDLIGAENAHKLYTFLHEPAQA